MAHPCILDEVFHARGDLHHDVWPKSRHLEPALRAADAPLSAAETNELADLFA